MSLLKERLRGLMGSDLDISEHLGLPRGLAMDHDVKQIVEIGFRDGVSATALASAGKPLTCYDIEKCARAVNDMNKLAKNFSFVQGDSLKVEIPRCDLLHIDSLHTYKQLLAELRSHAPMVMKWIVLHDTATFGKKGKDGSTPGLSQAIIDFLEENKEVWTLHLCLHNNNGLTLLLRIS